MLCLRDAEVTTFFKAPHITAWYPPNPLDVSNYSLTLGTPCIFLLRENEVTLNHAGSFQKMLRSPHSMTGELGLPIPTQWFLWGLCWAAFVAKEHKYHVCRLKNEFLQQSRNRYFVKNDIIFSDNNAKSQGWIIFKGSDSYFSCWGALVITERWIFISIYFKSNFYHQSGFQVGFNPLYFL